MKKIVIDCSTGSVEEVDLTPEEIEQMEIDAANAKKQQEEAEAEAQRIADLKASAKAKLIAGKALTEEEAGVLVI